MEDEHYGDYSMNKWNNYPVMKKKTPREEWIHKVHNDTYRARDLIRDSYNLIPVEVLNKEIIAQYCVLENLLSAEYDKWKDKK